MRNKISGIYSITNITTNKRYIGQTVYLSGRKCNHFLHLRRNDHDNDYLQKAFNKYGEQDFIFEVLEVIEKLSDNTNDKNKLTEKEQYWMDHYNAYNRDFGYNINPSASVNPMQGKTHTPEARKKISEAAMGRIVSLEVRAKISETSRNIPSYSQVNREKIDRIKPLKRLPSRVDYEYHIIKSDGTEDIIYSLKNYADTNNLSISHLTSMFSKGTFYRGWSGYKIKLTTKQIEEIISSYFIKTTDEFGVISNKYKDIISKFCFEITLNNKKYIIDNQKVFAKDNNLSVNKLKCVSIES